MADFSKPLSGDLYTAWPGEINGLATDLAKGLDPATTAPTNVPANAIRWNSASGIWEKFNGTTWAALAATYNINAATASKWATARTLAGNSVDGSANVAFANKFIVQGTVDAGLSAAQFLGALGTGILKVTTTTGVLSTAVAADFPVLNQNTSGNAATASLLSPPAGGHVDANTSQGLFLQAANGTMYDFSIVNPANAVYFVTVPHATQNFDFYGYVSAATTLKFGSGGAWSAGTLYSDVNYGCIFRARQAAPVVAEFMFANSAGTQLAAISSGGVLFASGYSGGPISGTTGTFSGATSSTTHTANNTAKAWCFTNNIGTIVSSSFNVASITHAATGAFVLNYSAALPSATHACEVTLQGAGFGYAYPNGGSSTTSAQIFTYNTAVTATDIGYSFAAFS